MKNEVDLKEYLQGKKVLDIKMFSINENYFVKKEGESYLIDGAIEFELEDGK